MKITTIESIPVHIPLKAGMTTKTAHGDHVESHYVVVRVHTDEGLVGLGEATVAPLWTGETSRGCIAVLEDLIGPALVGADPTQTTALAERMDRVVKENLFTKAAVEMALWDIAGKAAGVPVYQLFGGRVRDEVPIRLVIGALDLPRARQLAEQFLESGVRCLKVKVGLDPEEDVARVKAVQEVAGPNIPVGIDANCGWNFTKAHRALHAMADCNLLFAEQPIPPDDPTQLARLRRSTTVPIMADESVFTLGDAHNVTAAGAADVISVYPSKNGGIARSLEIAHVAKAAGIVCSMGSNLELGIASAAMLHLAVACPTIASEIYPADIIGPLYHEGDVITQPLSLGPPAATVPEGPGLGVEIDDEQLRRWRAD
jgi:L-alanine-DL-glutamate epimerase-like enolase superfamily enzyme